MTISVACWYFWIDERRVVSIKYYRQIPACPFLATGSVSVNPESAEMEETKDTAVLWWITRTIQGRPCQKKKKICNQKQLATRWNVSRGKIIHYGLIIFMSGETTCKTYGVRWFAKKKKKKDKTYSVKCELSSIID